MRIKEIVEKLGDEFFSSEKLVEISQELGILTLYELKLSTGESVICDYLPQMEKGDVEVSLTDVIVVVQPDDVLHAESIKLLIEGIKESKQIDLKEKVK